MSNVSTEALSEASRANSKGTRAVNVIEPSAIRAIEEAAVVGCGHDLRRAMIAEAAYYLAERRGFAPGRELEDWVAAEGEIRHLWTRVLEEAPVGCGG
jgi:hypothetical protein